MFRLPLSLALVGLLAGCATGVVYQPVPLCTPQPPPAKGEKWASATPDERLVRMTTAYNNQTRALADCNATIFIVNATNKSIR